MNTRERKARALIERHGRTYAAEAGIRLADKPAPLYQLLVLANLLSARISAGIAVSAAGELFAAGWRTPRAMRESTWQQRVDALGRGGYRRYDERTATMLGDGAELMKRRWNDDLRRLHTEAGDSSQVTRLLREFPGIGPTGAAIFCREVQAVWTDLAPYVDDRTAAGARRVGLPATPARLAAYAREGELASLVTACTRASLSDAVVDDVTASGSS